MLGELAWIREYPAARSESSPGAEMALLALSKLFLRPLAPFPGPPQMAGIEDCYTCKI